MTRGAAAYINKTVRRLSELDVLIVDCQTTGATPALGAVLELGWCVVRPSSPALEQLQSHWVTLPEGAVVSAQVRRLTGFDEDLAAESLNPGEAWRRLRASWNCTEPMPTAIHFARFELAFLRHWAGEFETASAFPLDAVCVHRVACRLYPELPRRGLRALAGYLGHGLELTRRSLGHVEATAFIWRKLSAELAERGIHTWDELGGMLSEPVSPSSRPSKRRYPMASTRFRALPDAPGVYRMLRSNGDVLYVGKAMNLRKRVASHFTTGSTTEQALEMLTQVSDVQVTRTATALEAALLENESIKALCPPYNVQLTGPNRPVWFSTQAFDGCSTTPDEVCRIGPLPSERSLAPLRALIALRSGEPATPVLRAWVLGTSEAWAPEESLFQAGFSDFCARHFVEVAGRSRPSARRAAFDVAKKLQLLSKLASKAADEPEAAEPELGPKSWDPERIVRHTERAVAQAYQLLRRARWICILHHSNVFYREPASDLTRLLVLRAGELVDARDSPREADLVACGGAPLRARQATFDRTRYDRLRVLSSELKRVRREQGDVVVVAGRGRRLSGAALDGVLRLV